MLKEIAPKVSRVAVLWFPESPVEALSFGAVSVVTPLTATTPIFVLILAHFFLKGVEVLTARVVAGTLLIVLGVYVITALAGG